MRNKEKEFSNEKIIERIYGKKIDCQKPPIERIIDFVKKVQNPEKIFVDGYQIEIVFNNGGKTIQDCIQDALLKTNERMF